VRWTAALAALVALLCLGPAARGAQAEDALAQAAGMDELTAVAEGYTAGYLEPEVLSGGDFTGGAAAVLEAGAGEVLPLLRRALKSGVGLLAVALLYGLTTQVEGTLGAGGELAPARLAGAAAIAALAAADVRSLMGLGRTALEQMDLFSKALLPTVTAACAAAGLPTAAVARQDVTLLFLNLLLSAITAFAVPLVYAYTAAWAAGAAVGNEGLKRLAGLLKWAVSLLLSGLVTAFVLCLGICGAISGNADALAQKAAKTAISGMVPVVGKILSDAAETVVAGAGVLRGSVGAMGLLTVLCVCLGPFLSLCCHYLVYKCAAALASTVAPGPMAELIDALGSAFALILGMTGSGAAILYVALVSSVSAVTP